MVAFIECRETLYNAITGEAIYSAGSEGLDFDAMMKMPEK